MRIVIPASGNSTEDYLSEAFARCNFFLIFDDETREYQFLENPFKAVPSDAGIKATNFLAEKGVKRIVSRELGIKAQKIAREHKMQVVIMPNSDIPLNELIEKMKQP